METRCKSYGAASALVAALLIASAVASPGEVAVLVEAESFANPGGWVVDPQFVPQMGSPFLLAHGGGKPVANASTTVRFAEAGAYHLWVRTRNWTAHPDAPGRFKLTVNGTEMAHVFGTQSATWSWQDGGTVEIPAGEVAVSLRDLTGFEGRCDAIAFIKGSNVAPPDDGEALRLWRASVSGLNSTPSQTDTFDCVIVGGGMAGCCASLAAARSGVRVALIHDRAVPGGNASQEIRVATRGEIRSPIVDEIDTFAFNNRDGRTIGADTNRLAVLQAETNLMLFLLWQAGAVGTNSNGRIQYVEASHVVTGERRRFAATTFIDCTGDGWIGYWAGADYRIGREAAAEFGESRAPATADQMTMGNSLMWNTANVGSNVAFPAVPMSMAWATEISGTRASTGGDWDWEYGMHLDTIENAEQIRDHLLRAIYGNFYNAKQNVANATLGFTFLPYLAGKRESRRLMGDHIVTQGDITNGVYFEDAIGTATWGIDLHYPTATSYISTYTSTAVAKWYYPFRSLYSRNVPNLMMAGRCISVSHVGLGSPRVQNTTAQMGVAVGYAAALCKQYGIEPRDIYRSADRTIELQARIGGSWPERPRAMIGTVIDNADPGATIDGAWTSSTYDNGYYGTNYLHDANALKGQKSVSFRPALTNAGSHEVFLRWTASNNRATNAPVTVVGRTNTIVKTVNQQVNGSRWVSLGVFDFNPATALIVLGTSNTTGHVIADAVCLSDPTLLVSDSDRDQDGLPDWWERWHFLSETKARKELDADADGLTNYQEYLTGTDPNDADSKFNMRTLLDSVPGQVLLSWPSTTNLTYRIEVSEDIENFRTYISGIQGTPPRNTQVILTSNAHEYFKVIAD